MFCFHFFLVATGILFITVFYQNAFFFSQKNDAFKIQTEQKKNGETEQQQTKKWRKEQKEKWNCIVSKLILLSIFFAFLFFFEKTTSEQKKYKPVLYSCLGNQEKRKEKILGQSLWKLILLKKLFATKKIPEWCLFFCTWILFVIISLPFCAFFLWHFSKKNKKAKKFDNKISFDTI